MQYHSLQYEIGAWTYFILVQCRSLQYEIGAARGRTKQSTSCHESPSENGCAARERKSGGGRSARAIEGGWRRRGARKEARRRDREREGERVGNKASDETSGEGEERDGFNFDSKVSNADGRTRTDDRTVDRAIKRVSGGKKCLRDEKWRNEAARRRRRAGIGPRTRGEPETMQI